MSRTIILGLVCFFAAACARSSDAHPASHQATQANVEDADSTVILLAAGDIAACTRGAWETAQLLDSLPGEIIIPGDAAYLSPVDPNPYVTCYDSTWGRHKSRTHPVVGNHDVEAGEMYFDYFGAAAGPRPYGFYSFEAGAWHILALNSTIEMGPGSDQGTWVAADLEAHPSACTLAFMHHPRFSSGPHSKLQSVIAVFPLLENAGVDVVVSGHDHIYERFAPMRRNGRRDDERGVRQFVVGTGGNSLYTIPRVQPNSEARSADNHGILKLTLRPRGYDWEFVPTTRTGFHDAGSGTCH